MVFAGQVPFVTQHKQVRCTDHLKECYGFNYVFPVGCMQKTIEKETNADVVIFEDFYVNFNCFIQRCFICRPSDFTVSEDTGPYLIQISARSHPQLG
jgi:hypothetical protein